LNTFWSSVLDFIGSFRFWIVIGPNEIGVRTFCGKREYQIGPGFHLYFPFVGEVMHVNVTEQVVDVRSQSITTKDNVTVAVGISIAYEIVNAIKAIYRVNDFDQSLCNESLRVVEGYVMDHTFDECRDSESMKTFVLVNLRKVATDRWGIKIHRIGRTEFAKHRVIRLMQDGR